MKQTTTNRILEVLTEGPSTAGEVAADLEAPRRKVNARMVNMYHQGLLSRSKHTWASGSPGRKTVWLYAANGRLGVPA